MEREVTLLDLLAAFRRAWVWLLPVSLGAGLGVYGVSALLPNSPTNSPRRVRGARTAWVVLTRKGAY